MKLLALILLPCTLASAASHANDRPIPLNPVLSMSWGFPTPAGAPKASRIAGVGFWQRASGAKSGVGENFVGVIEYQLPEAAPARVRSASFQFSGRQSQCAGAEPVVIEVYAYAADGKSEVADACAGSPVAQMSADCKDSAAFARPIDVTQIVRQLAVPSGIRHVGFNIRKANNRQGPGLFNIIPGKLTVVLADQDIARAPKTALAPAATPAPAVAPMPATGAAANPAVRAPGRVVAPAAVSKPALPAGRGAPHNTP